MFRTFRQFLSELVEGEKPSSRFDDNDVRLAAAALLVHAAAIDGRIADIEQDTLRDTLQHRFELDASATDELVAVATEAEREAVDLYRFTRVLNRTFDEKERSRIVEMIWEVVYADGVVGEFEDNLVWRAADLLGISQHERIALRQRVAERRDASAKAR
jgi:uncharacterized tellurite resistance protein B-like protein